jgi:hypothetical protein
MGTFPQLWNRALMRTGVAVAACCCPDVPRSDRPPSDPHNFYRCDEVWRWVWGPVKADAVWFREP